MADYDLDMFLQNTETPEQETSLIDYNDIYKAHPLIQYAIGSLKATENINLMLTPVQIKYLEMLNKSELKLTEIIDALDISKSDIVIWSKTSPLFKACIDIIKDGQAELLEAVTWDNALSGDSKTSIERMFALKARKPEYRDNAAMPAPTLISLRVTLEGQDIDTTASYRTVSDDLEPEL